MERGPLNGRHGDHHFLLLIRVFPREVAVSFPACWSNVAN